MPVGNGSKSGVGAAGRDEEAVHKMHDGLQVASLLGLPMVPASRIRCCCHEFSFFTSFTSFLEDCRLFGLLRSNFQLWGDQRDSLWSRSAQKEMSFRGMSRRDTTSRGRTQLLSTAFFPQLKPS